MRSSNRFAVAVHIMSMMAWAPGETVKSGALAKSVRTNPVVIRRLLCLLANERLVVSQAGASGGSRLARPPHDIPLLEVWQAVEPDPFVCGRRMAGSRRCPVGGNIGSILEQILEEAETAFQQALACWTIGEVVEAVRAVANGRSRLT
jgi:Rrf2 family protein